MKIAYSSILKHNLHVEVERRCMQNICFHALRSSPLIYSCSHLRDSLPHHRALHLTGIYHYVCRNDNSAQAFPRFVHPHDI